MTPKETRRWLTKPNPVFVSARTNSQLWREMFAEWAREDGGR